MPMTEFQELAASSRGGARLVSAAAGSGKTRVLVERLMRWVDEGHDIDEFLVVTYTRAAAGEMRGRILAALNEHIAARPDDRRLRRQTELCARAAIGTIDSICGRFLRENAHRAGISPDFRVVEPDRAETILAAALEDLLEDVYKTIGERPDRRALVDSFGAGRDDAALSALITRLHNAVQSHPHPADWLASQRRALAVSGAADAGETVWGRALLARTASQAGYWAGRMEKLMQALAEPGREKLMKAYGSSVSVTAEGLRDMERAAALGWEAARAVRVEYPRIGVYRGDDPLAVSVKAARADCKKRTSRWEDLFADSSAQLLSELEDTRPALDALLELCALLEDGYAARKRQQNAVDFSDQEHMVLTLLEDASNGLAAELSARYTEVLVDEYQDVNACQDSLFRLLSDGGRKLFMVGDVKQSIYRFRLADPTIFLEKYAAWPDVTGETPDGASGRILLRENFRSRPEVLAAVNHVFENIMSPALGELRYDEAAALRPGLPAADTPPVPVRFTMLSAGAEDAQERPDRIALEADHVAASIRALLDEGVTVTDNGVTRPAVCGDFAILLRSHKNAAERFRDALSRRGIPSVSQQGGGFFRSLEVTVLLSMLAVVDNPRQDVALIAALRSPLYGFTADDLAEIRAFDRDADFYTALTLSAAERSDCAAFLAELEEYRALAADLSVEALLGRICDRRDFLALVSAMPDGEARRENIRALGDYAREFELDGYRGLFRFLSWLRRLEERGEEPRTGSVERRDAVQIISIHHSKGLEYPIVFLAGTARQFNRSDTSPAVLLHPRLGVGGKVIDTARGVRYPSLAWRAIADTLEAETLSEEMRVLYVAMTRARERLYISGAWPDAAKHLDRLREGLTSPLEPELLRSDNCMGSWLARAAVLPGCPMELELPAPGRAEPERPAAPEKPQTEPAAAPAPEGRALWTYPVSWASTLPSKLTASGLEGTGPADPDAAVLPASAKKPAPRRPRLDGAAVLTAAEKGVAVHTALQFIDYAKCVSSEGAAAEIQRLRAEGRLSASQAEAADPAWILGFFRSKIGRRVLRAEKVWRELRFSLLVGAETFFPVPAGEQVLLQGVVDCCILEDGQLTIIDYKTDYVNPDILPGKAAEYAPQLRAYAAALRRILQKPVKEGVLFFLRTSQAVSVPLAGEKEAEDRG